MRGLELLVFCLPENEELGGTIGDPLPCISDNSFRMEDRGLLGEDLIASR
jgi:hypothetical protein